ncbi:hypothetical protein SAICODRAFT_67673 [Saitoella complicata NRRL Y-17804]|uniref:Uncharacterized protein n=1 Tax=Saitoella complicata (strain BCRC 22490 / CBS 7301 / JCM 7358 / NBRC 10748 / NRRL Y-17804) TaxID=698492 RepID=A0A0E9NSB5_SAICN|nr:uncharacterized protein SAICODRAFT_67673 [Saitoella complicata NRRL Y-17804]ODQ50585.1 hypothetical protein SAICODRAFT_67673 [Saitoella complicata NRRL Y-17804]GAO52546.1 hypothetical protein G7K_6620-t1 [Saitoella complicata NRRL Y-17804]
MDSSRIVPYNSSLHKREDARWDDFAGALASFLPMTALFLRRRWLGWIGLLSAIAAVLNSKEGRSSTQTPPWTTLLISLSSLFVVYLPILLQPGALAGLSAGTSTGASSPVPANA